MRSQSDICRGDKWKCCCRMSPCFSSLLYHLNPYSYDRHSDLSANYWKWNSQYLCNICNIFVSHAGFLHDQTEHFAFRRSQILSHYKAQLQFNGTLWGTWYMVSTFSACRPLNISQNKLLCWCSCQLLIVFQICVPQLQVDGGRKCWLPRASAGLHPPGLSGLRRHLDEAGGQFWQAQTHQQRAGWPGTRKRPLLCHHCWSKY